MIHPKPTTVDLSMWQKADDEPLGETDKRWFIEPATGIRWLYKPNRIHRAPDEGACEAATSRIATLVGIPAATVELAQYQHSSGCLSRNVLSASDNEMEEAASYLVEFAPNFDPKDKQSRGHSAVNIRRLLDQVDSPIEADPELSAADWFAGYLVFDALIGNTDRHSQNWAIETTPTGSMHLAPSFDHATSLGINTRGEKRDRLLAEPRLIPAFAAKGSAHRFEGGRTVSLVDYAAAFLDEYSTAGNRHWRDRLSGFPLADAIEIIRSSTMSVSACSVATIVIESNMERLRRCLNC